MNILKMFVHAVVVAVIKVAPIETLKAMFQDEIDALVKKHLTVDELLDEGKDFIKWLKEHL